MEAFLNVLFITYALGMVVNLVFFEPKTKVKVLIWPWTLLKKVKSYVEGLGA